MRLRSFNLGIPFLTIPEARVLLDRIRRADPARLKYVIIEPATAFVLYPENATTRRAVRLHDFETAWFSLRYVWLSDFSVFKRLGATYSIILAHGYNVTNAGLLSDRLFPKPETPRDTTATEDQDGYRSLESEEPIGGSVRRKRFLERRAWFEERVARMKSNDDPGRPLHAHHEQVLLDLAAGLRSVGVETIYLIPPAGWELGAAHQARVSRDAGRLGVKLLHYNHPREHPEYFEPDLWFDISHLTREGAVRLTRRVATDFVGLVGGEPGSASSSNTEPASR